MFGDEDGLHPPVKHLFKSERLIVLIITKHHHHLQDINKRGRGAARLSRTITNVCSACLLCVQDTNGEVVVVLARKAQQSWATP